MTGWFGGTSHPLNLQITSKALDQSRVVLPGLSRRRDRRLFGFSTGIYFYIHMQMQMHITYRYRYRCVYIYIYIHTYVCLFQKQYLSCAWEALSSSFAPHWIGNMDTLSSLAPSQPLNRYDVWFIQKWWKLRSPMRFWGTLLSNPSRLRDPTPKYSIQVRLKIYYDKTLWWILVPSFLNGHYEVWAISGQTFQPRAVPVEVQACSISQPWISQYFGPRVPEVFPLATCSVPSAHLRQCASQRQIPLICCGSSFGIQLDCWEKNGKTGELGHFMLVCPLLWFLCLGLTYYRCCWCFMCCMFWGFFVPNFSGTFCVWMRGIIV